MYASTLRITHLTVAALMFITSLMTHAEELSPPGMISGTIMLNGCRADEVDIQLRAAPLARIGSDGAAGDPGLHRTFVIRATPISDHVLAFDFPGLTDQAAYRIGIKASPRARGTLYPPNPCSRMIWEGLSASVAMAGGARADITGTRVAGALAVFTGSARAVSDSWARAGVFGFSGESDARIRLRWTPEHGVTSGILQIALQPFGRRMERESCSDPEGLLLAQPLHASDLLQLGDGSFELPPLDAREVIVPPPGSRTDGRESPIDQDVPEQMPPTVTASEFEMIALGRPVYARILPMDDDATPRCDTQTHALPPWIVLVHENALADPPAQPPPTDQLEIPGGVAVLTGPVVYNRPNETWMCMRATRSHVLFPLGFGGTQFDQYAINYGYQGEIQPGKRFCWPTNTDSGGFDPIGAISEVFGGILTPFEWLVNNAAGLWQEIQSYAVNAVAQGITQLGIDCDAACKSVLRTGLQIGMAAAGIPPSIPNFEQLKQQGLDYVAAQIASQTGIPDAVTNWAVTNGYKALSQEFLDQISDARVSGIPGVDWAVWDGGIEPATLALTVKRTQLGLLPGALRFPGNAVFAAQNVPIPKVFLDASGQPGADTLQLSISLMPNLGGWKEPDPIYITGFGASTPTKVYPDHQAVADSQKDYWKSLLEQNLCVPMRLERMVFLPIAVNPVVWVWVKDGVFADFGGAPTIVGTTATPVSVSLHTASSWCAA